ncbi:MAG: DUF6998 domain-containing protein [Paracoccus sp. (in: a-proteobacteria)]
MSLSQTQIIKSLADALQWFERELAWGAPAQELRHLTGRIGELYTAMITRGQMASRVNQQGYDVVSAEGEHISVKTVTSASRVDFRKTTISQIDRVVILRINIDEGEPSIEEVLDEPIESFLPRLRDVGATLYYPVPRQAKTVRSPERLKKIGVAVWNGYQITQMENGSILVEHGGIAVQPAKPILREIARDIGVDALNAMGNRKNTRSLGADVIRVLESLGSEKD